MWWLGMVTNLNVSVCNIGDCFCTGWTKMRIMQSQDVMPSVDFLAPVILIG
jgi:hypothetical protein